MPAEGYSQRASELSGTDSLSIAIELDTSLETTYYNVEGVTTESIFNNIERNGPTDGEGKRGSGLTSVVWGYEWQGGSDSGVCTIRSMTIQADMVVTLPEHLEADLLPIARRPVPGGCHGRPRKRFRPCLPQCPWLKVKPSREASRESGRRIATSRCPRRPIWSRTGR